MSTLLAGSTILQAGIDLPLLLVGLLVLAVVITIGRLLLRLAWRLVVIAVVIVAIVYFVGAAGIGLF